MYKGTIIENSLGDKSFLSKIRIDKTWKAGEWVLHSVQIPEENISGLSEIILPGWYMHFWKEGSDNVIAVFRDKIFTIKYSDKSTWKEAVAYGKSAGIPEEQLDFLITD